MAPCSCTAGRAFCRPPGTVTVTIPDYWAPSDATPSTIQWSEAGDRQHWQVTRVIDGSKAEIRRDTRNRHERRREDALRRVKNLRR